MLSTPEAAEEVQVAGLFWIYMECTTTAPSGEIVLHSPFKGKASIEDKNNMKAIDGIWFYFIFLILSSPEVTPN